MRDGENFAIEPAENIKHEVLVTRLCLKEMSTDVDTGSFTRHRNLISVWGGSWGLNWPPEDMLPQIRGETVRIVQGHFPNLEIRNS